LRLTYDPASDLLSIRLRSGAIARSEALDDGLVLLLDADDHVLGFSFADARKRLTPEELTSVTYENLATQRRESLRLP
jgi:uncharacterized protein YuzE